MSYSTQAGLEKIAKSLSQIAKRIERHVYISSRDKKGDIFIFNMKQVQYLSVQNDSIYIGFINGKTWVVEFTDNVKANACLEEILTKLADLGELDNGLNQNQSQKN